MHSLIYRFITILILVFNAPVFAEKLPVEYFASLPDVSQVRLSPDGKNVASLVRLKQADSSGTGINVMDLTTKKQRFLLYAANEKYFINWIRWANEEILFVSAEFPAVRHGTPTTETRLLLLNINTNKTRTAIPKRYYEKFDYMPQIQDRIVSVLPEDRKHFLLQVDGHSGGDPSVYKISLYKNSMKTVQNHKKNIDRWIVDRQYNVRIGIYSEDTHYKIRHRFNKKDKWRTLWSFESFAADQVWPIGFDQDPNFLFVRALHEGRDAIFKVNLKDPDLKKTLVYANKNYDVDGGLLYSNLKKKVIGIETDDANGYQIWDPEYRGLFDAVGKALKDTRNIFLALSDDGNRYIVLATSDTDAGAYYVGDRSKKSIEAVALRYSKLDPAQMAEKNWITYKARDGLEIEAALTLPLNRKENESIPTVIFPHGGPISYSGAGFDYWTQFFANRGYAVLQMNFRGSSGYGHDFMAAGLGNWGLEMQDDIEDGTRWMIEKGYADPEKICIVGASYGGYAALMGAVKSPDLYQCAVSFAGVTDIAYLVKSSRRYSNFDIVKKQIGSNYRELAERSPLKNADKINVPTLLIHGTKDRSVRVQHSKRLFKAMKKRKKNVAYIELEKGTHYLSNNENRLRAFTEMAAFLDKYL